ncbi:uncharacterized protein PADG_11182 [Paracoccidioides brasiliensis Pb18]|uniref:DUF7924 domain-containing protein n=1 Tax=Paracoccidioides brasiliensis (strain Pb18) TaxID=502780 RepID=A0A0A0HUA3_PARBD|nr:uncharacterized protein PADG_11182 [Paracoccidioides brasiliensis Pb18]KGM92724.1 hypothetical protein PADG_11182 [Paracoccidioides brasiliensis Pb18]
MKPNHKQSCEDQVPPFSKQPRLSTHSSAIEYPLLEKQCHINNWKKADLIEYWCKTIHWPEEYFEAQPGQTEDMSHLLAKKNSSASLRHMNLMSSLDIGSNMITDQESRDEKNAKYRSATYETLLATKGSFMRKSELGITDKSKQICKDLVEINQPVPKHTLFRDNTFDKFCQRLQGKNESRVIQDISNLIVPSAESLTVNGAKNLKHLVESPDYAAGFDHSAFTEDQLNKFEPFLGYDTDTYSSFFLATFYMYFPFLTSEVKGTAALDIADRQKAHSMTLAVRGVIELFKTLRIYGHYAVIEGSKTLFYRHPIRTFDFTELDGREKWTAYTFTRNVYEKWSPDHLKRIRSAIDAIPPGVNFDTP